MLILAWRFDAGTAGFGMEEDIQKSHEGGFRHHLIKPVDLNKLDAIIQQLPVAHFSPS